jgi:hypothetical protein
MFLLSDSVSTGTQAKAATKCRQVSRSKLFKYDAQGMHVSSGLGWTPWRSLGEDLFVQEVPRLASEQVPSRGNPVAHASLLISPSLKTFAMVTAFQWLRVHRAGVKHLLP